MADEIDTSIDSLVRRAMASPQQRAANEAAEARLKAAAERERQELDDKWHADQPVLAGLARKASAIAAGPFLRFAYHSEPAAEAAQLGAGRFVAECRDGSQATLFLDAFADGRVALGYTAVEAEGLVRELPLLSASEEAYAEAIVAYLALLQRAKRG